MLERRLEVYLIDGTYELFRHYYALPSARDEDGREIGAVRGVVASVLGMISAGAAYVAVATDQVIESFRNDLWPGYKTGTGIDPDLLSQFPLLEEALVSAGVVVWPMVEFEADDALAAGAALAARDRRVDRIVICTPDKDLAQSVRGSRIVQLNRRTRVIRDEAGVIEKFGVAPPSIPTTSRSSAIPLTGIRDFAAGARNRRPRCWRSFFISNPFPPTLATGTSTRRTPARWHGRSSKNAIARCCSERSRRSGPTSRSSMMSRSCVGPGPRQVFQISPRDSIEP